MAAAFRVGANRIASLKQAAALAALPSMACQTARRAQPVEHEEGALDLADFLERDIDLVLPLVGGEFSQHDRRCDVTGLQRCDETDHVVPMLANDFSADSFSQK